MLKRLFGHSLIYGLSPHIPRIASILILPIITAYLTEVDYGVFGLITAIVEGLTVFSALGMNVVLSNSFYRSPGQFRWAWRQIYGFLILWNFLYAALLCLVLFVFIPTEAAQHTWLIILLSVAPVVVFGPTATIGQLFYQLGQKPFQIALRSIIIGLITVSLNLYFIAYEKMGYLGWFLSIGISQLLLQTSYFVPIRFKEKITPIFNFKWRFIKSRLKIALPTIPHYYGGYLLNTSDRVVMKVLGVPIGGIGLFNAANTISNLVQKAGVASGQAIGPLLLQSYKHNNERQARFLVFALQIVFLAGTFTISIWMKDVFYLLISNVTLREVYPLSVILVMAYNYRPMYFGANYKLFYLEKTKSLPKITLVAGLSNVILNIILIPIFGYQVAVYTSFIALMYMGFSGYFLKHFKESNPIKYYPLLWLFIILLLTCLAYYLVNLSFSTKLVVSVFALLCGFVAIFTLRKKNSVKIT